MNFLAHLYIAEARGADAAGAVLGDAVRGRDLSHLPPDVAESVRLHRRIDSTFDRHQHTAAALARIDRRERRYGGITLDLYADHWLATHWAAWHDRPFSDFCAHAAAAVAARTDAFDAAGVPAPTATRFAEVLRGVAEPEGIDRAINRIAQRARQPDALLAACGNWRAHGAELAPGLAEVLRDCLRA